MALTGSLGVIHPELTWLSGTCPPACPPQPLPLEPAKQATSMGTESFSLPSLLPRAQGTARQSPRSTSAYPVPAAYQALSLEVEMQKEPGRLQSSPLGRHILTGKVSKKKSVILAAKKTLTAETQRPRPGSSEMKINAHNK